MRYIFGDNQLEGDCVVSSYKSYLQDIFIFFHVGIKYPLFLEVEII